VGKAAATAGNKVLLIAMVHPPNPPNPHALLGCSEVRTETRSSEEINSAFRILWNLPFTL
jgi:hypothetical protein